MHSPSPDFGGWPRQLLLGWFNLVLTAPLIYLYIGLPLVLRQHGWSGTDIGLMQLAGMPAMLKFLLATPVDRYRLGRASYRNWSALLLLGYAGAVWLLATHDLASTPPLQLFALAMLVSVLGTWTDVPLNALAIQLLPAHEWARAGSIRSAAIALGAIVGGGVMLLVHARLGWALPFHLMAAALLSTGMLLPLLKGVPEPRPVTRAQAGWRDWMGYFKVAGHQLWALLVLVYYPFIGAVWLYLKPLLLDHGFAPQRIAFTIGIVGGLAGALAGLLAGRLSRQFGPRITLPALALFNLLSLALLNVVLITQLGDQALMAAALVVALAMGASASLLFGLMMNYTRPGLAALDYGLQSSLFVTSRTCVPLLAGVLLDHLGYAGMLACLWVALALVCLLAWHARDKVRNFAKAPGQSIQHQGEGSCH